MLLAVLACLVLIGAAVYSVLNQSITGHRRRNAITSAMLIGAGGLVVLGTVIGALAASF
jgi:prolipoprotein diacylglyceryltransferase